MLTHDALTEAGMILATDITGRSVTDIIQALLVVRKDTHPDRFTNPETRRVAEERFKRLSACLTDLSAIREREQLAASTCTTALAVRRDVDETLSLTLRIVSLEAELSDARRNEEMYRGLLSDKDSASEKAEDSKRAAEIEHISAQYRPRPAMLVGVGLTLLLSGSLAAIAKLEEIALIIRGHAPSFGLYIDIALASICGLTLLVTVRRYVVTQVAEWCDA